MNAKYISSLLLITGVLLATAVPAQQDLIWERQYDLRSGGYAQHIFYEPEDGYLLVSGVISQYDGDEGYNNLSFPIVMRLGYQGEPIWIHEGAATKIADAPVVTRCDWGGYLIIGATKETEEQTPYSLTAKNVNIESGEVIWEQTYPTDSLTSVRAISAWNIDGGRMLIFGWTHPAQYWVEPTNDNVFVMEISTETGECFSTTYIAGTERVTLTHVQRIYDGGFLLVGKVGEPEPRRGGNAFVASINSDLEPVMWQTFEGEGDDNVTGIAPYIGGYYLLCANYDVELEMEQSYLIKMNLDGEILWRRSLGGDWRTCGYAITLNNEGNFWVGGRCIPQGENGPDMAWIAGVSSDGELLWQETLDREYYGTIYDVNRTRDGGVFVAGWGPVVQQYGPYAQSVSRNEVVTPPKDIVINRTAPNPFNSMTIVSYEVPRVGRTLISLIDVSGRTVRSWTEDVASAGEVRTVIDGGNLVAGAYWLKVQQGERVAGSKIVLLR